MISTPVGKKPPIDPFAPPTTEEVNSFLDENLGDEFLKLEDLPDGSTVYEMQETMEMEELPPPPNFYENLAETLNESKLSAISYDILEGIDEDIQSRSEWEQTAKKAMKYLGFKLEEMRELPFMAACRAFDTTFSSAVLRFCAVAFSELFPIDGPFNVEPLGEKDEMKDNKAIEIKDTLNYYATEVDREYYPDSEQLLFYLCLFGSAFRKVYSDPLTKRPLARFIDPNDIIINNNCVSLLSSSRITHREKLTQREIKLRQLSGFYRNVELEGVTEPEDEDKALKKVINQIDGVDLSSYENNTLYYVYEVHVDLDDVEEEDEKTENKDKFPKPYIVSICQKTKKVLGLWRNWKEGDPFFKRIEYFVQHDFIKGPGLYGLGFTHLAGSNSIVLTSVLRQLIDAGTLKNFPGGLIMKGLRVDDNDKAIGPSEFRPIETGGLPIQQVVMPMPYNEPSGGLIQLRNDLINQTQGLISTTEMQLPETQSNVPVGTTLARMEEANRVQTRILKSLRVSLGHELTLIYNLFKNSLSENNFSFKLPGKSLVLSREDFIEDIKIVSNSNPQLITSTQRIMQAQMELQMALSMPQLHDLRAAFYNLYKAYGMPEEKINKILPPNPEPVSLDPVTENMNALKGIPIIASLYQDHPSHILSHEVMANDPGIPPNVKAELMIHIQVHKAMRIFLQKQMSGEIQVPNPETIPPQQFLADMQIQNEVAMEDAQKLQEQMMMQQQNQPQPPMDPNELIMADIAQKQEAAILKDKEAHLKAETEAFKSQQKFDTEKMKIEANMQMAEEKNQLELLVNQMKLNKENFVPLEGEINE
jgi:hypothetical protein